MGPAPLGPRSSAKSTRWPAAPANWARSSWPGVRASIDQPPDCSAAVVASAACWQAAIAASRAVPSGALSACLEQVSKASRACWQPRLAHRLGGGALDRVDAGVVDVVGSRALARPGARLGGRGLGRRCLGTGRRGRRGRCRRCRSRPRSGRMPVAPAARRSPYALASELLWWLHRAADRRAEAAILIPSAGRESVLEQRVAVLAALVGELGDRGHALVVVVARSGRSCARTRPAARVQKVSAM